MPASSGTKRRFTCSTMVTTTAKPASAMPSWSIGKKAEARAMDKDMKTHAVREFHVNHDEADRFAEEIRNIGFTVVESGFSADELQLIRQKIDDIYEQQVREMGSEDVIKRINDADLVRCIIGYDDYFLTLATHPLIMAVTRKLLGENFILMAQNAIINRPAEEHYQVTWHRDLNYQHYISS